MKNKIKTLFLLGGLVAFVLAMPTSDTNNLKNKAEISKFEATTLKDTAPLFDGIISDKPEFSVLATTNKTNDQNLVVRLKHPFYVRRIVVYLSKTASCKDLLVRYSKDTNFWLNFDDIEKKETAESIQYIVEGHSTLTNYLAFVFLADPNNNEMRIQEIELYPEMDVRLKDRYVKDKWINTDRECFNDIDTKIDTVKFMKYSKVGAEASQKFKKTPDPVLEGELFSINNLEPGTPYEYIMNLTDYNGNMLELSPRQFMTKPLSLAYQKKAEGTFTEHYNGTAIKPEEIVLTDGSCNIDKSLAMSGPVTDADQYVIIDLDKPTQFSEVIAIWRNLGFSKDYSIQVSNDKNTWQTIAQNQNANQISAARIDGHPVRVLSSKFEKTAARYIKLFIKKGSEHYSKHGNGRMELFEVKVFN